MLLLSRKATLHCFAGQSVVQFAEDIDTGRPYAIKFFLSAEGFTNEASLVRGGNPEVNKFLQSAVLPMPRDVVDQTDSQHALLDPHGNKLPSCIVTERGLTLQKVFDSLLAGHQTHANVTLGVRKPLAQLALSLYTAIIKQISTCLMLSCYVASPSPHLSLFLRPVVFDRCSESFSSTTAHCDLQTGRIMQAIHCIAQLLTSLHEAGLVHQDVKPANILQLAHNNTWTLIDFGCVEQTGAMTLPACTARYAAPEVVDAVRSGKQLPASPAQDAWALGVIAFDLLTGTIWAAASLTDSQVLSPVFIALPPLYWDLCSQCSVICELSSAIVYTTDSISVCCLVCTLTLFPSSNECVPVEVM